ncbi:hypothetical protein CEUSTIGMA_g3483.t1 [Chlamydomonas eustigma]|uniref:Uncharacterized protein n=1 Tax=Chlamydomonas eustigma TaxID=1157962 RepID=A0A250WZV5_9CHLO|nr:hypothetical protein CEUSTIGMA_g3483.t1 [Chlamydomonas eustigma]|eukprot:GAX76040.1 hypothetical protein CEUSTIGMA_g3483.t1 [Chlamydomonas eustigma]
MLSRYVVSVAVAWRSRNGDGSCLPHPPDHLPGRYLEGGSLKSNIAPPPRPQDYGHKLSVGPATSLGHSSLRYGPDTTASLDPKFHLDPKSIPTFTAQPALTPGSFAGDSNAQSVLSIVQKLKASRSTKGDESYAPYPPGLPNKLHPQVSPDENPEAFGSRVFHSYAIFRASGLHLFTDLLHEFSTRRVLLSGLRQYQSVLHDVLRKVGVQSTSEEDILAYIVVATQSPHEFDIAQKTSHGFYPPTSTQPGPSATPPAGAMLATHLLRSQASNYIPHHAPAPSYSMYPPRRAPAPAAHVTVLLEDSPPLQDSLPYFTPDDEAQEFSGFSPPSAHPSPAVVVDTALTTYPATMHPLHPRGNNRAPLPTTAPQQ